MVFLARNVLKRVSVEVGYRKNLYKIKIIITFFSNPLNLFDNSKVYFKSKSIYRVFNHDFNVRLKIKADI